MVESRGRGKSMGREAEVAEDELVVRDEAAGATGSWVEIHL